MKSILLTFLIVLTASISSAQVDSSYYTVRLSAFEATILNNTPQLRWKTVCFLDYANFQIQVSEDGLNYKTLRTFSADKLRCEQPFNYADNITDATGKLYYRINLGNIDGKYYSSGVKLLSRDNNNVKPLIVYPTAVSSVLSFTLKNSGDQVLRIYIRGSNGQLFTSKTVQGVNGIQKYSLAVGGLQKGVYILQVAGDNSQSLTAQFIKL
ncbi:MAG: T9SS type A sorting domain-containing protein [Bacteroidota bacterium]|nr:T9SS type A sorting domain-containing protein [Bacteroidota bacterium]